jgi:hypothetical protein
LFQNEAEQGFYYLCRVGREKEPWEMLLRQDLMRSGLSPGSP